MAIEAGNKKARFDFYLAVILVCSVLFTAYWTAFTLYKYIGFRNSFYDLGQETYFMYVHLHYPGLIGGLQFLVFSNHISPFKLLLLPVFALYQSPMALVLLQDVALALCAVVAYMIGRDVVKSRFVGLALGLAFLVSPGVRGIAYFDAHVEAFIPLFFLLSFYFYMRERRICFLASYIAMISTIETAPFVGISLLLGLLFYELVHERAGRRADISRRNRRLKLLLAAFLISVAFIAFYYYVINALLSSYSMGGYSGMPPFLKVVNFLSIQTQSLGNISGVAFNRSALPVLVWWGILILFFGFGLTGFRNIVLTGILISPWVLELIVIHNTDFAALIGYYYSYSLGGALAAAALGFMIIMGKRGSKDRNRLIGILAAVTIVLSVFLSLGFLFEPYYFQHFVPSNWTVVSNYSQVEGFLMTIPPNSSVMAQPSIAAHLYWIKYIELPPNETVWGFTQTGFSYNIDNITSFYRTPDYIVINRNLSDFNRLSGPEFQVDEYMGNNYTEALLSGGFRVYKRVVR
ncbi:MAG: DUF2079 domain-containing protein [Candidatus Micrarchaeota archaeon]|nr:DUF2079 domain-containing protein [Candidatus Micrarchaeota archaeon]